MQPKYYRITNNRKGTNWNVGAIVQSTSLKGLYTDFGSQVVSIWADCTEVKEIPLETAEELNYVNAEKCQNNK